MVLFLDRSKGITRKSTTDFSISRGFHGIRTTAFRLIRQFNGGRVLKLFRSRKKLDGINDDVTVGICCTDGHHTFCIEHKSAETDEQVVDGRCQSLVDRGGCSAGGVRYRNGNLRRPIVVSGVRHANFVPPRLQSRSKYGS